jgi:hypothetical protein
MAVPLFGCGLPKFTADPLAALDREADVLA